jgi:hypothetical protein
MTSSGDVGDGPVGSEDEARRLVHPGVGRHDAERPAEPGDGDREPTEEMGPRRQVAPAVDVDRDEDRLEEEEQALDRKRDPERAAEATHEHWPEETHLEERTAGTAPTANVSHDPTSAG